MTDEYFMTQALKEAKIAFEDDEIPIGAVVAVSYTHLRAHETVLDLVCRLLLEKKKTSQPHVEQHI